MKQCGLFLLLLAFSLVAMPAVAADLVSVDGLELRQVEPEAKFEIREELVLGSAWDENMTDKSVSSIERAAGVLDITPLRTRSFIYTPLDHGNRKAIPESLRVEVLLNAALG